MAPYPLVHVEVARQIALIALFAPKIQRHGGYRACAYQFAHFIYDRLPGVIPSLDRGPQLSALHFARNLRQLAIAGAKTTEEIRASRNVVPPDVCCSDGVELQSAPHLHVFRQRRTGAAKRTNARKITAAGNPQSRLFAGRNKSRPGAKERDPMSRRKAPQHAPVRAFLRAAGTAIEEADGGRR